MNSSNQTSLKDKLLKNKFAWPVLAILGLAVALMIVKSRPAMEHTIATEKAQSALTITAKKYSLRPSIIGYGTVDPESVLSAKAEVSGRILYRHPQLKKGTLFAKGTLLLQIDDKDYQLALKQAESDLLANKASLQQMQLNVSNTQVDLKIAQKKLSVAEKEYQRAQSLRKNGSLSQSDLDRQYQTFLQQKQEVVSLESRLSTLPADIEVIKTKIAIAEAKVIKAQRDIERTQVTLPFSGRISQVYVEKNQFVTSNAPLFDASDIDKMSLNGQFAIRDFRQLLAGVDKENFHLQHLLDQNSVGELLTQAGLTAKLYSTENDAFSWPAKVERISDDLDPQSHTVGVVATVDNNYQNLDPETHPPLVKGMYLAMRIAGITDQFIVIPRSVIHQNQVYVVDQQQRLQSIPIKIRFTIDDYALLLSSENSAITAGTQIVSSDLFPAVNGMLLAPEPDQSLQHAIEQFVEQQQ